MLVKLDIARTENEDTYAYLRSRGHVELESRTHGQFIELRVPDNLQKSVWLRTNEFLAAIEALSRVEE